ncbi:MAG: S-adenosylmethionine:tRNA ribosyltransferase-isomerase, partial [Bryobacteraceae bacterium]
MRTSDFEFLLPKQLVAQTPAPKRDFSRLMVLHRDFGAIEHRSFRNIADYLREGDVLVLNDSRVIPARLRGVNARTGGEFEVLLLEEKSINDWWVMLRPGRRARVGTQIAFRTRSGADSSVRASVTEVNEEGHRRLRFTGASDVQDELAELGEVPLPPYISRAGRQDMEADHERYQTVYARPPGSVAAPTAGLHFTTGLLNALRLNGVNVCFVTLHVGLGTFAPVKSETLEGHRMHEERYTLSEETVNVIAEAKRTGRRVIA